MYLHMLVLACLAPVGRCYPSGFVTGSCDNLSPRHRGVRPQSSPAPYSITVDKNSFAAGEEITVRLQADSAPFKGFMLQAREVGGSTLVGSFSATEGNSSRLLTCSGSPDSAIAHSSGSSKTSIQATWRAPTSGTIQDIQLSATFVTDFSTIWVQVRGPLLRYNSSAPPVTTTSTPVSDTNPTPVSNTNPTPSPSSTTPPPAVLISSDGCGTRKVCFSRPLNCDPAVSTNCYFLSAMMASSSDTAVRFELTGPSQGYISMGFSDDQMMGGDDIYICGLNTEGLVQLQHAFSTGRRRPEPRPLGNVSDISAFMRDGVISCSFTSRNPISTQRTSGFSTPYHLLFAHGLTNNGQIQFHTMAPFISEDKVDISRPQLVTNANRPHIIKAHGALMLTAWMTTGSLGMIIARYLKGVAKGKGCYGKDVWFVAHVSLMTLTVAATILAFILSFSHVGGWSGGAHPVLGCLVMILAFFQPIGALFRCGPHHHARFIFNYAHALNAVAIKILSVAAIFTGLRMIDSFQDKWLMKVMGGFLGWEAVLYILLEVHSRWNQKDGQESGSKLESIEVPLFVLFSLGNVTFLLALLVGIGMS